MMTNPLQSDLLYSEDRKITANLFTAETSKVGVELPPQSLAKINNSALENSEASEDKENQFVFTDGD